MKNMLPGCKAPVLVGSSFQIHKFYTGYPEPLTALPGHILQWLRGHAERTERWKTQWERFSREQSRTTSCERHIPSKAWAWSLS